MIGLTSIFDVFAFHRIFAEESESTTSLYMIDQKYNDIKLTVETDKKAYHENEAVKIKWKAENLGSTLFEYPTLGGCYDPVKMKIESGSDEFDRLIPADVLLVKKDDPRTAKFDSVEFYGKILSLIESGETRPYGLLMLVGDKNKAQVVEELKTVYNAENVNAGVILSFVSAQVPLPEIPNLAENDLIGRIGDGEGRMCPLAGIDSEGLKPGSFIENSFSWSQLVHKPGPSQRVDPGIYNLKVNFGKLKSCTDITILGNATNNAKLDSPQLPNVFQKIPIGNTNELDLEYHISSGQLDSVDAYFYGAKSSRDTMFLLFNVTPHTDGNLTLNIPDGLIQKLQFPGNNSPRYQIVLDGIKIFDEITKIDHCNYDTLIIPFDSNSKKLGFRGESFDKEKISGQNATKLSIQEPPSCWWNGKCQIPDENSDYADTNIVIIKETTIESNKCNLTDTEVNQDDKSLKQKKYVCLNPTHVSIEIGESVTWENQLERQSAYLNSYEIGWIYPNNTVSKLPRNHTFTNPGIYPYEVHGGSANSGYGWIRVTEQDPDETKLLSNMESIESRIPDWIKINTKSWTFGESDQDSFVEVIQYLIQNNVINRSSTYSGEDLQSIKIPVWIKIMAIFWVNEKISDDEFIRALQYLVDQEILIIPQV